MATRVSVPWGCANLITHLTRLSNSRLFKPNMMRKNAWYVRIPYLVLRKPAAILYVAACGVVAVAYVARGLIIIGEMIRLLSYQ